MSERSQAYTALAMSTLAFTLCFAVWTLNGVLVTFLVENGLFRWDTAQIGWLIGIPVLTGSVMRLPVGLLTDRFGGRKVYTILLLLAALPTWLLGSVHDYQGFLFASLGFGLSGAAFAVGIAYSSVWFSKARQGTALGIFGAGNAGSAITSMGAPLLLKNSPPAGRTWKPGGCCQRSTPSCCSSWLWPSSSSPRRRRPKERRTGPSPRC